MGIYMFPTQAALLARTHMRDGFQAQAADAPGVVFTYTRSGGWVSSIDVGTQGQTLITNQAGVAALADRFNDSGVMSLHVVNSVVETTISSWSFLGNAIGLNGYARMRAWGIIANTTGADHVCTVRGYTPGTTETIDATYPTANTGPIFFDWSVIGGGAASTQTGAMTLQLGKSDKSLLSFGRVINGTFMDETQPWAASITGTLDTASANFEFFIYKSILEIVYRL